jgi:predicted nucleotidyltransferase
MSKPNVICQTIFGSRLYGTDTPESDWDYKGIYLPTAEQILDQEVPGTWSEKTNKSDSGRKSGAEDTETELFSLGKFLDLLAESQMVSLDIFFSPFLTREKNGFGGEVVRDIIFNRDKLISKNVKAGLGFAKAQAHKYSLKGTRIQALEAVLGFLKKQGKSSKMDTEGVFDQFTALTNNLPQDVTDHIKIILNGEYDPAYVDVCGRQFGWYDSFQTAHEKLNTYYKTYGQRAHQAEEDGSDRKAWLHAVRVSEELLELLTTGNITFPRPEADLLLKIRRGEFSQEYIGDLLNEKVEEVYEAQRNSKLPEKADTKWIREFVRGVYRDIVVNSNK